MRHENLLIQTVVVYLLVSVAFLGHPDAFLHVSVALDVINLFSYVCLLPAVLEIDCSLTVFIVKCSSFWMTFSVCSLILHVSVFLRAHAPVLYTYVVSFGYLKLPQRVSNRPCLTSSFCQSIYLLYANCSYCNPRYEYCSLNLCSCNLL